MSSKSLSKFACESNCNRLVTSSSIFLWTFTTADSPSPRECADRWKNAVSQLTRKLCFYGVRVFEMHPSGHGMHVHLVTNSRFDVNEVRAITTRCGFGRINVKSIPSSRASYIAKYITKASKVDPVSLPRGVRSWAIVGRSWFGVYTRVKDCEIHDAVKSQYKLLSTLYKPETPAQRIGLARVSSLIVFGLVFPIGRLLDSSGFVGRVPSAGDFVLSLDNCFGLECDFSGVA